jgi:hypothetical protein
LRVGQWAKSVVIFLSSSIPQSQANRSAVYHDTGRVVVKSIKEPELIVVRCVERAYEHRRYVFTGKGIGRVRYEETCLEGVVSLSIAESRGATNLANGTITCHHTLL